MRKALLAAVLALFWLWVAPLEEAACAEIDAQPNQGTIGTWWWDSTTLRNEETVEQRLAFLQENKVNEIYLCAGPTNNKTVLRSFIQRCNEMGIRVACLSGDASWIEPDHQGFDRWYRWFCDFQEQSSANQKFYGIHLDVEPYQAAQYALDEQACWNQYADFVARVAEQAHRDGITLELDIPFWLDEISVGSEQQQESLLLFLAERVDTLCIMSYRDTASAMFDLVTAELQAASCHPVKLILGAETLSNEGDYVSYQEEGKAYMREELTKLYHMMSQKELPSGWGIAIHSVANWIALKE